MARPSSTMPNSRASNPVDQRLEAKKKRDAAVGRGQNTTPRVPTSREDAYSGPAAPPPPTATVVSPTGRVLRPATVLTQNPVPGVTRHEKKGK